MTNKQELQKVMERLESDAQSLPLARSVKDIVPAEGNPQAQLMFIGEAAGYHEHVERRPFVGPAGKLLTRSLEENGLKREDVWISNILKVRPPQNRDPLPEEIEAYRTYLDEEIQIIKPKIIATLGRFSMGKFIPDVYITRIHGQAHRVEWKGRKIIIFPMYHPAAALRNQKIMEAYKADFVKLANVLQTLIKQSEPGNTDDKTAISEENQTNLQLTLL
ncbi:MAG: hypothetical protein A2900_01480 [Candidatus Chisholmbacteria bacterium RIFCSPLOWO2_01_FULL_50_28]|uniref:Type-4 uracil-DNA glycosylase n=1 Tax=Candidatus Chisholmbacteria bacterium RIFCSPHIGHO2_01_FULL_52_32 TaxID=1797591 RepID=A0A1G1VTZ1_9BACT|nr:MAG: hypothetical protein A2786_05260 [Candidatus Chisholmbacteria bacterium RIFCSPHIGHO2_01_FULL_52_32]OGY19761.1 MAG: hypothetical protein A2900_01480 [Candidatus Chisholmbacteria bacterium RIFCSPLOWO2_01_FULL_50_28]